MRIRFAVPDTSEGELVRALRSKADEFLAEAARRCRPDPGGGPLDHRALERELTAALSRLASGLIVEVAAADDGDLDVALSPAEDPGLEPLLAEILGRAPRIPGVRFVRHFGERSVEEAVGEVRERFGVDLARARLRIGFSRGHLLEVVVLGSAFSSATDGRGLDAANLLVLRLIGGELFDDWVGAVDIAPAPREQGPLKVISGAGADTTLSLAEALPAVEAALRGVYAELPEAPYRAYADQAKWTLFEVEPGAELDYPEQDDIALASTVIPEAMKCFLERGRFSSKRFSKHGEFFAYLKVDATDASADERHALRVMLEEALAKALSAARIGCVVGAGLGVRYVYIDVALENVDHGVRTMQEAIRRRSDERRSWVLFCDATLAHEWVGVWDDAPAPPAR